MAGPGSIPVAVVAQASWSGVDPDRNEVEILMPVVGEVFAATGLTKDDMGFICSGSSDYLAGMSFSFVAALDAVGAWPPLQESHVEMDGAWALYEAWVRLQHGDVDTALVYSFGKSSMGDLDRVLALQLDPYLVAPLWPGRHSLAALQARMYMEGGHATPDDLAEVVARSRTISADDHLASDPTHDPLRDGDCPPVTDGACAVVLAAGDRARELCDRPAWITGVDHRTEPHALGLRDLTTSPSTRTAAERSGALDRPPDVAELCAPYSHQELILRDALGLREPDGTTINPSGGALRENPVMSAGLIRIAEAAAAVQRGDAGRAVAHATAGPCLQQNLVAVLDSDPNRREG